MTRGGRRQPGDGDTGGRHQAATGGGAMHGSCRRAGRQRHHRRGFGPALGAAVALSLVDAACGGEDSNTAARPTTAAPPPSSTTAASAADGSTTTAASKQPTSLE